MVVMYSDGALRTELTVDLSESAYSQSVSEVILNKKIKLRLILIILWDILLYTLF